MSKQSKSLVPSETIEKLILVIRGQKVILDRDLADLYQVATGNLNKAVNRNRERFPDDFMFLLTPEEFKHLKFHFGISSWGGTRKRPRVFTEQGVAMLSGVLRSARAVAVNIEIMRVFVRMRRLLVDNEKLAHKLAELERTLTTHDRHIMTLFEAIRQLMAPPDPVKKKPIGFQTEKEG